ncbi:MAG: hypothetical protein U1F43_16695 [Myxococcota bacterium]
MSVRIEVLDTMPGWASWRVSGARPTLFGASLYGPHDSGTIERFLATLDDQLGRDEDFHFLADNIRLRPGDHDAAAFVRTSQGAIQRMPRLNRVLRRWATISANHAVGLAIAGSQRLLGARYPAAAFKTYEEAIAWLGYPELIDELAAWLRDLPAESAERNEVLGRLGELLRSGPGLDVGAAARRLGLGVRTLQRMLAAAGTTFKHEQARARVRLAERLVGADVRDRTTLARAVGLGSADRLAQAYQRYTGRALDGGEP